MLFNLSFLILIKNQERWAFDKIKRSLIYHSKNCMADWILMSVLIYVDNWDNVCFMSLTAKLNYQAHPNQPNDVKV